MKPFYYPTSEHISRLDGVDWVCSYSGGKDSTSLVTWIEWMRREKFIVVETPKLVLSDTGVEYPFLMENSHALMKTLEKSGWQTQTVTPETEDKLYVRIFGRGSPPVDPAHKKMRWCTKHTKIIPIENITKKSKDLQITGMRWGESKTRDLKLLTNSCHAGGECGIPKPGEGKYSPIINWTTCHVHDWLQGLIDKSVQRITKDLLVHTRKLCEIYQINKAPEGVGGEDPVVTMARFGCIGCPALAKDRLMDTSPEFKPLKKLYLIWRVLRDYRNRLWQWRKDRRPPHTIVKVWGPIKMEVRKNYFQELLKIQEESGVTLVTQEDTECIYQHWKNEIYPKGWSKEDEPRCKKFIVE